MPLPRPLDGLRVVDFTWVRAGPWATRWLGAFGAEVIKVEWPQNLDPFRQNRANAPPGVEPGPNSSGTFADTNANKVSVTVNMRSERGMEILRELISISDVVIENFSSRVMRRRGLGYDDLRKLRPDVIYVSMAGLGQEGRDHAYTTMGPSAQALSGMTYLSGLPDEPPAGWGWSYMDDSGGLYGAMCVLTALRHRDLTGQGQHVDLAQMTVGITMTGSAFLDRTVNGRPSRREGYPPGNRTVWPGAPRLNNYRGAMATPHNSYRTKGGGYNDWCVIACFSDDEWRALVELMGNPDWAQDAAFATMEGRIDRQDEIDAGIEDWTATLDKYQVMERCQDTGVLAMPVQSSEDRVERDPQLSARGMYKEMDHPVFGSRKYQNTPFRLSGAEVQAREPAPLIGQHTRSVAQNLLGLSREDVVQAYDDGVLWPAGMARFDYIEEALT